MEEPATFILRSIAIRAMSLFKEFLSESNMSRSMRKTLGTEITKEYPDPRTIGKILGIEPASEWAAYQAQLKENRALISTINSIKTLILDVSKQLMPREPPKDPNTREIEREILASTNHEWILIPMLRTILDPENHDDNQRLSNIISYLNIGRIVDTATLTEVHTKISEIIKQLEETQILTLEEQLRRNPTNLLCTLLGQNTISAMTEMEAELIVTINRNNDPRKLKRIAVTIKAITSAACPRLDRPLPTPRNPAEEKLREQEDRFTRGLHLLRTFGSVTPPRFQLPNRREKDYTIEVEELNTKLTRSEPMRKLYRLHLESELDKFTSWAEIDKILITHARHLSSKDLRSSPVSPDGNCLLYATNISHQAASANNYCILDDDDLRILTATLAREWTLHYADQETKPLLLTEIDDFIHDKCAFINETIMQALSSIRNGRIYTIEEDGTSKINDPNAEMRGLLLDNPSIHPSEEPIYLLNRLTGSAHYDATIWLRPAPPGPNTPSTATLTPHKRQRPTGSATPPSPLLALRPRLSQTPPENQWPPHPAPPHSPQRTPPSEELHDPDGIPSPIQIDAQTQQPEYPLPPVLTRKEINPATENTQPRGPTAHLPPIGQGRATLSRQLEFTNSPPNQRTSPTNEPPPSTQNEGSVSPNRPQNSPSLRESLPRIPSPNQQTSRVPSHAHDESPIRTTPKLIQTPSARPPLPLILPPNRHNGSPATRPPMIPATSPDSNSSTNTQPTAHPTNQSPQIPHLPPIHVSGCGFESHQGPLPPVPLPPQNPEDMSKSQLKRWNKHQRRAQQKSSSPSEQLPPIPKPSNWANMTASEKDNWRYKHK